MNRRRGYGKAYKRSYLNSTAPQHYCLVIAVGILAGLSYRRTRDYPRHSLPQALEEYLIKGMNLQ